METYLLEDSGMKPTSGDSSLYVREEGKNLSVITGIHVDYLLNAWDQEFQDHTKLTLTTFEAKPGVYDNSDSFGTQIRTLHDGSFTMLQT